MHTGEKSTPQSGLDALKENEAVLIRQRRAKAGYKPSELHRDPAGIALSGGGIRSATFCLGLFQGLAKQNLIRKLDYLSTVSGGGYFGSVLGRMFTRSWANAAEATHSRRLTAPGVPSPEGLLGRIRRFFGGLVPPHKAPRRNEPPPARAVRPAPARAVIPAPPAGSLRSRWCDGAAAFVEQLVGDRPVDRVTAVLRDNNSPPLRWLREAGNYLTPNGVSDAAMDSAVFLRNWVAVLVVLLTSLLTLFLGGNFLRSLLDAWRLFHTYELHLQALAAEHWWWTPWSPLAAGVLALVVAPVGLAYWLTQAVEKRQFASVAISNLLVIGMGVLALRLLPEGGFYWPAVVLGLEAALGLFWISALVMQRCWLGPRPERHLLPDPRLGGSVVLVCGLPIAWRLLMVLLLFELQHPENGRPASQVWACVAAGIIFLVGLHHLALRTAMVEGETVPWRRWVGAWNPRGWNPALGSGYMAVTLAICAVPALLTAFAFWLAGPKALGLLDVWTVLAALAGIYLLGYEVLRKDGQPPAWDEAAEAFGLTQWLQRSLSVWLKRGLLASVVLLLLAITNTLGQSLYATVTYAGGTKPAAAAIMGLLGLSALAPLARSLAAFKAGAAGQSRVPFKLLALAGAGLLAFLLALSASYVAHGIAWRWGCPVLEESTRFLAGDLRQLSSLARTLQPPTDPLSEFLSGKLLPDTRQALTNYHDTRAERVRLREMLADDLNTMIRTWGLSETQRFSGLTLRPETRELLNQAPQGKPLRTLYRLLLEDAYPRELSRNSFLGGLHRINHRIQSDWFLTTPGATTLPSALTAPSTGLSNSPGAQIYQRFVRPREVALTGQNLIQVQPTRSEVKSHPKRTRMCILDLGLSFGLGTLLTLLFGQIISFLNLSSFHKLYTARLTRAYLGASNRRRWEEPGASITEVAPRDDIRWHEYRPHASGGPLHLLNVTVNCTVGLATGRENRTAKGFNLCVGPAGLSFGSEHALSSENGETGAQAPCAPPRDRVWLAQSSAGPAGSAFVPKAIEPLSLGEWVGISGAAFTTGLGNVGGGGGTSLGTSLLCGLFNVRLGYWWKNEFSRRHTQTGPLGLPLQTYLLDELTGSFRLENRDRWYLSDGGHFENTAAYELIRRQAPFIIISDAGADPEGNLDDVANLVRRARLDFGAEIEFFDDSQLLASVDAAFLAPCVIWRAGSATGSATAHGHDDEPPAKAGRLGVLEDLRTYRPAPEGPRRVRAHATLAWVRYPNARKSLLLLVKPGITEDLPPDLLNYQRANPDFPQQSTLDQFFDEAQWESYRKLGERIAAALFAPASSGAGKWSPHQFCRLPEQPPDAPQAAAGDS